jgi:hypothetical protein
MLSRMHLVEAVRVIVLLVVTDQMEGIPQEYIN